MRKPGSECEFEGCYEEVHAKGLCPAHHAQRYQGKALTPVAPKTTPEERFWVNVSRTPECWEWVGRNDAGRGRFWGRGRLELAHVFSYEIHHGVTVSEGREIDHKCRNKGCVNPAHLREVTRSVNAQNKNLSKRNTSGYKGVHWNKKLERWSARVRIGGRSIYVGYYDDVHEAGKAALLGRMDQYEEPNAYDRDLATRFGIDYPDF